MVPLAPEGTWLPGRKMEAEEPAPWGSFSKEAAKAEEAAWSCRRPLSTRWEEQTNLVLKAMQLNLQGVSLLFNTDSGKDSRKKSSSSLQSLVSQ